MGYPYHSLDKEYQTFLGTFIYHYNVDYVDYVVNVKAWCFDHIIHPILRLKYFTILHYHDSAEKTPQAF